MPVTVLLPHIDLNRVHAQAFCMSCCPAAGLDPDKDTIIEIACLITDADLTRVWEVSGAN
jgi:oligoribonuclease (3'-5' exoribonuclease)